MLCRRVFDPTSILYRFALGIPLSFHEEVYFLFLSVQDQDEFGGKEITVSGWIRNIRISKNFGFIELNDGTFFKNLQIVIESDKLDNFAELSKLNIASAITATGTLVLTPDAKQPFELKAENVVIDGESTPDYPLQKKRHCRECICTRS